MSNIRRLLLILLVAMPAMARQAAYVNCQQGGKNAVTAGMQSTNFVMQSFPGCTISVFLHSTVTLATLFSDNSGTALGNPFTASLTDGHGVFYADNGRYDVQLSGGGIPTPSTISDVLLNDPASSLACSALPALVGDITSAGATCTTVLPNIATPGTNLKTTINAKGQVTSQTTAASTDLTDTAIIARLNAAANFGANPITGGTITGTSGIFSGSVANTGETVSGEVAPDATGRAIGDTAHRWDGFLRNLDISGSITGGGLSAFAGIGSPTPCTNQFVRTFTLISLAPPTSICNTVGSADLAASLVLVTPNLGVAIGTSLNLLSGGATTSDTVTLGRTATDTTFAIPGSNGLFATNAAQADLVIRNENATKQVLIGPLPVSGILPVGVNSLGLELFGVTSGVTTITPPATGGGTWAVPAGSDNFVGTSIGQAISNKQIVPRVVTLTTSTTFTPDSNASDQAVMVMTGVAGTLTIAAPTGSPNDGQKLILRIKTTNAQTYSFNATYHFSTTVTAPTATIATKTDYIGCIWNATNTAWDVVAVDQGH